MLRDIVGRGGRPYDRERTRCPAAEVSMPLYLDEHEFVPGLTGAAVADAHARDLEVGPKHGVTYLRYWYDEATGKVFCLVDAPSVEAAEDTHREAHGLMADRLVEVKEGT
jgi:hypothetical protein